MGILRDGMEWLDKRMGDVNSVVVPIIYRRGAQSVSIPRARIGASYHQADSVTGGQITWRSVDFLISSEDLTFDGGISTEEPQRGDEIESQHTGEVQTYLVTNPNDDAPYTNSDEYEFTLRIHTELITPIGG